MRPLTLLFLVILAFTLLLPFAPDCPLPGPDAPSIGTLDVCHGPLTGISPDLPFLSACPCMPLPLALARSATVAGSSGTPIIFAAEIDRPPEPPRS
jgi:hypothetical protein